MNRCAGFYHRSGRLARGAFYAMRYARDQPYPSLHVKAADLNRVKGVLTIWRRRIVFCDILSILLILPAIILTGLTGLGFAVGNIF